MNASDYLKGHGWRGEGFSLDHSNRGISRPLLVAHKQNLAGLGTDQNQVASQWWLNAFDKSLKTFGEDKSTLLAQPTRLSKRTGLYGSFIKAETLKSTLKPDNSGVVDMSAISSSDAILENGGASSPTKEVESHYHGAAEHPATPSSAKSNKTRKHRGEKDFEEQNDKKRKHSEGPAIEQRKDKKRKRSGEKQLSDQTGEGYKQLRVNDETKKGDNVSLLKKNQAEVSTRAAEAAFAPLIREPPNQTYPISVQEKVSAQRIKGPEARTSEKIHEEKKKKTPRKAKTVEPTVKDLARPETSSFNRQVVTEDKKPFQPFEPIEFESRGNEVEPRPESIAAAFKKGKFVDLHIPVPGADLPVGSRPASVLKSQGVDKDATKNLESTQKKKSDKAAKIEREKAKRVAKREAKHWEEVCANPHLYRPDGTAILETSYNNPVAEIRAKHEIAKLEKKTQAAEKMAKRELKEQLKVERRVARKMRRAEKKRKNHMAMQAHISAKIKRQKAEKDQAAATERGMTLEAYQKMIEDERAASRLERDKAKADEMGISLEAFQEQRETALDAKELAKEARELGLSLEDYANQDAEIDDSIIDSFEIDPGVKDGNYEHFGRSPVDTLWAKFQAENSVAETTKPSQLSISKSTILTESDDGDEDSDTSSSTGSSDASSPKMQTPKSSKATESVAAGTVSKDEDFISLDFSQPMEAQGSLPFVIDTIGDPNLPIPPVEPKKRVKDMTKEERKARLVAMRARRAEKAAHTGTKKLSKKERRKKRTQRKEEILSKMTSDILSKKQQQEREREKSEQGSGERRVNAQEGIGNNSSKEPQMNKKQKIKEARREARRIMRGVKKGRYNPEEVMPGWELKAGKKRNLASRGNGGREPKRP